MKTIGILAGSFDPITNGHIDLIKRSLGFCEQLIIGIGVNLNKKYLLDEDQRLKLIYESLHENKDFPIYGHWRVEPMRGLLIDFAKNNKANLLIRGVRSVADYEYEMNMAHINKQLAPELETLLLPTSPELGIISSTMVKEIAKFGGDVSKFVPKAVNKSLKSIFAND